MLLKGFFLFLLFPALLLAVPDWYNERIHSKDVNTYYGYGSGMTQKDARAQALREIAEQISSNVSSSISMQTVSNNDTILQNIDSSTVLHASQI